MCVKASFLEQIKLSLNREIEKKKKDLRQAAKLNYVQCLCFCSYTNIML